MEKIEGRYTELEVAGRHGHTAAICRHDDGDSAAVPILEEAQRGDSCSPAVWRVGRV